MVNTTVIHSMNLLHMVGSRVGYTSERVRMGYNPTNQSIQELMDQGCMDLYGFDLQGTIKRAYEADKDVYGFWLFNRPSDINMDWDLDVISVHTLPRDAIPIVDKGNEGVLFIATETLKLHNHVRLNEGSPLQTL